MSWANNYIKELQEGRSVTFTPRGNSMTGLIDSGDVVTVEPVTGKLHKDDIVLCRVAGNQYLHLITAVQGDRYQISNNHGHINGWTTREKIYGVVACVTSP